MKLLEGKFFKDWCIFLAEQDNRYFVLYGKIGQIEIKAQVDYNEESLKETIYSCFPTRTAYINIPFVDKDDKLYTLLNIHNKEEYHTIVEILEDMA